MAKLVLGDITNITGNESSATATLNANNQATEDALENTLSRDGTSPNEMNADLDMNAYDIINVGNIDTTTLTVGGVDVQNIVGIEGPQGPQGDPGVVQSVVAGTNISIDNTDPANPVVSADHDLPIGGTTGQVLKKASGIDYDTGWQDDGGGVASVADRTALAALTSSAGDLAFLAESGREGLFQFSASDLSSAVSGDTAQGLYVAPASDPDGSSGAWVRQRDGEFVDVCWYGAKPDGTGTDDAPAINAAIASLAARVVAVGIFFLQTKIDFTPWGTTIEPYQRRKIFDAEAAHFYQTANLATAVDLCPSDGSVLYKKTIKIGTLYGNKATHTNTRAVYHRHVVNCDIKIGVIENWAGIGYEVDQTSAPGWGGFACNIDIVRIARNTGDGFKAAAATSGIVGFEGNVVRIAHSIDNGGIAYHIGTAANQRVEGNIFHLGAADGNTGTGLKFGGKGNIIDFGAIYSNGSPDIDCYTGVTERNTVRGWRPASQVISSTVTREHGINGPPEYTDTGSVGTTSVTTEETLMGYSIPAGTLKAGMRVKIRAWGSTAANANNKIIKLKFGAAGGWIGAINAALNNVDWAIEGEVVITGTDAQEYRSKAFINGLGVLLRHGTSTEDDGSAVVCALTGQNGTASANDIVCQGFGVELLNG